MSLKYPLRLLGLFTFVFVAGSFFAPAPAQARRHGHPRYLRGANNAQCARYSWKPTAKSVPGGRAGNARVPFMQGPVNAYLQDLSARGCGLVVQSTFRSCRVNSHVGGAQKSRHLCGGGADTSGCSKPIARSVCGQHGMKYIEEGRARFPHCQVPAFCNQIQHD